MSIDALKAAQIYAQVARVAETAPQSPGVEAPAKPDFGALVASAVTETSEALKAGESAAMQAAAGEAGLVDVVTAISAAEVSLETAIAIRNRVIEAYQEIMRMPI